MVCRLHLTQPNSVRPINGSKRMKPNTRWLIVNTTAIQRKAQLNNTKEKTLIKTRNQQLVNNACSSKPLTEVSRQYLQVAQGVIISVVANCCRKCETVWRSNCQRWSSKTLIRTSSSNVCICKLLSKEEPSRCALATLMIFLKEEDITEVHLRILWTKELKGMTKEWISINWWEERRAKQDIFEARLRMST